MTQSILFYLCFILKNVPKRPGVNFTNILQAAFTRADPKSAKKTVKLSSFFALFGSGHIKAARKMLVKLTPDHIFSFIHDSNTQTFSYFKKNWHLGPFRVLAILWKRWFVFRSTNFLALIWQYFNYQELH